MICELVRNYRVVPVRSCRGAGRCGLVGETSIGCQFSAGIRTIGAREDLTLVSGRIMGGPTRSLKEVHARVRRSKQTTVSGGLFQYVLQVFGDSTWREGLEQVVQGTQAVGSVSSM